MGMKMGERVKAIEHLLEENKGKNTLYISTPNLKAIHRVAKRALKLEEENQMLREKVRDMRGDLSKVGSVSRSARSEYAEERLNAHDEEMSSYYGETREEWIARINKKRGTSK